MLVLFLQILNLSDLVAPELMYKVDKFHPFVYVTLIGLWTTEICILYIGKKAGILRS